MERTMADFETDLVFIASAAARHNFPKPRRDIKECYNHREGHITTQVGATHTPTGRAARCSIELSALSSSCMPAGMVFDSRLTQGATMKPRNRIPLPFVDSLVFRPTCLDVPFLS